MASLQEIQKKHLELCRELNMDKETETASWKSYQETSPNCTLEGDPLHWLCCSLYAACRESLVPTVGNSTSVVKGNCVSLTKLLRSCNISIYEFFLKIKKWIEMTNLSQNFRSQIERLERSFSVSFVLYKKYNELFERVFLNSPTEKKNKKSRPIKCPPGKLFDFGWCLFLCAKGEDPKYTVDLVTSFHLLLCCLDLIYENAVKDDRKDLINPSFPSQMGNSDSSSSKVEVPSDKSFRALEVLCKMTDASFIEAMHMKKYSWKNILSDYINNKTIRADSKTFYGIISNTNFEPNFKSVNNIYEQYVLSVGEFDERIFLSNINLKKSTPGGGESGGDSQVQATLRSLEPGTPFTRRHHLPNKEVSEPLVNATQNVQKLRAIAEKQMSASFANLIESTRTKLNECLNSMEDVFINKYSSKAEALERFRLARAVYFNLLEKIIRVELKTKPNLDPKILLESDVLHITLIACCVEIVLVAYNSQIKFPWVLECFDLNAFHFYKVIEIVVLRHEDALTRSIIIHLNSIEEKCLDSLVWISSSPIWDAIKQLGGPLPSWINVENRNCNPATVMKRNEGSHLERNILQSPVNSAYDCFEQSSSGTGAESARRDLFNLSQGSDKTGNSPENAVVKKSNKAGSLFLFFRKFYKLAFMRISELCRELSMKTDVYLNQIWTLFEHSIVENTDLMRDRHLDQMLMCAIYVFIRVKDIKAKTFTDIMKFYRNQPQAASNIYRNVLIKPAEIKENGETIPAQYHDIIHFYNQIYVQKMTPYALNFGDKSKSQQQLLLSPHPPERLLSPRKVSANHQLFIQTLEKVDSASDTSSPSITYQFSKSPNKNLERMNQLIQSGKRTLPFNDDDKNQPENKLIKSIDRATPVETTHVTRKIHGIIRERQEEERNN